MREEALKYLVVILVNRILAPKSKRGVSKWVKERVIKEFVRMRGDEHVNRYYEAMDEFYEG